MESLKSLPKQRPSDLDQCQRIQELFHQVFHIELLREKILNFVIHDEDGFVSTKNAGSCRLVNRDWLNTVTKCLVKLGEPLFKFAVTDSTFLQFLKLYGMSRRVLDGVPPFRLTVCFKEDEGDMYKKLRFTKYVRSCNSGLVQLRICVYIEECNMCDPLKSFLTVCRRLRFPALRDLEISLDAVQQNPSCTEFGETLVSSIQWILNTSTNLTRFCVSTVYMDDRQLPRTIQSLIFPGTVKNLTLLGFIDPFQLKKIVAVNTLPNLTDLIIHVPYARNNEGTNMIYETLHHVRNTLQNLEFREYTPCRYLDREDRKIQVAFPMMKCLKRLTIIDKKFELADGVSNLQINFPCLTELSIRLEKIAFLRKWMDQSCYEQVDQLYIEFYSLFDKDMGVLTLEMAQSLQKAFPNLLAMEVTMGITPEVESAFRFLIEGMSKLESLAIKGIKNTNVNIPFWDSLFNESPEEVVGMEGSFFEWQTVRFDSEAEMPSSINLFGLKELDLYNRVGTINEAGWMDGRRFGVYQLD